MSRRFTNPFMFFADWGMSIMDAWLAPSPARVRRANMADATTLATLHAANFAHPWSAITFEQMLGDPAIDAFVAERTQSPCGFIIVRRVADEAEILSIAVAQGARRSGAGALLADTAFDALVRERIRSVFLEVEAGNVAAIALYARAGFVEIGKRRGYYRSKDGVSDALTMRLDLQGRSIRPPLLDA